MKFKLLFISLLTLAMLSCNKNDIKIAGEWERTESEDDCDYIETYIFYDDADEDENEFEYSFIPTDDTHIGYSVEGKWSIEGGKLKMFCKVGSVEPVYNFTASNSSTEATIEEYISDTKVRLSEQNSDMKEDGYGVEIKGSKLIFDTPSGKETFKKVKEKHGMKAKIANKEKETAKIEKETEKKVVVVKETPGTNVQYSSYPSEYEWLLQRRATYSDIAYKSKAELRIMRNYIFARHGYRFKSKDLQKYFGSFPWYTPVSDNVTGSMNKIEKANIEFIKSYE